MWQVRFFGQCSRPEKRRNGVRFFKSPISSNQIDKELCHVCVTGVHVIGNTAQLIER
jgi:hypothetical protein